MYYSSNFEVQTVPSCVIKIARRVWAPLQHPSLGTVQINPTYFISEPLDTPIILVSLHKDVALIHSLHEWHCQEIFR
jgi:hypothetical protein